MTRDSPHTHASAATCFAAVSNQILNRRMCIAVACAAVLLSPMRQIGTLQAQDSVRTVLITASGGIAKGSYQGGVDWTISEFLRRQRDPSFRRRVGLDSLRFEIGSASGASAGNINALISALAWCTDSLRGDRPSAGGNPKHIKPEESLFWKAWVNTGFTHLLPKKRSAGSEPAVLDRRFFEEVQKSDVQGFLERAVPIDGKCEVPVGVTMTKLSPVRVPLTKLGGDASVQRFASVFRVTKRPAGGPAQLDFAEAGDLNTGSLGALALLPSLESTATVTRNKRLDDLFEVILASSSFPVAFAPKTIEYLPGGLLSKPQGVTEPAAFSDGGLFDNNPLALAVRLYELSHPSPKFGEIDLALTTPHRLRGVLQQNRRTNVPQTDHTGLGAIIQMFQGAWPSAQEYELHSLARLLARDEEIFADTASRPVAKPRLRLSSRSSPIVGEQLWSFGAFLGRSFREYDFYTGIYDGLEFVARNFLCNQKEDHPPALRTCIESAHVALVDDNILELDVLPRQILARHRYEEYRGGQTAARAFEGVQRDRLILLEAIHRQALILKGRRSEETTCKPRNDVIAAAICASGFDLMLDSLSRDTSVKHAADRLRRICDDSLKHNARGDCSADEEFVSLLESPRRYLNTLAERALNNLEEAEDYIKERRPDLPQYSASVEAVFSQYRAATFRYRKGIFESGLEINPSSARVDGRRVSRVLGSAFAVAAPNYVNFFGGGRVRNCLGVCSGNHDLKASSVTAGWRPLLWRPAEQLYLTTRFELSRYQDLTQSSTIGTKYWDQAWGASAGSNVWTPKGFSSVEFGVLATRHIVNQELQRIPAGRIGVVQLSGRMLAEKVQLDLRWRKGRAATASIGVSDVNGLLYWWFR